MNEIDEDGFPTPDSARCEHVEWSDEGDAEPTVTRCKDNADVVIVYFDETFTAEDHGIPASRGMCRVHAMLHVAEEKDETTPRILTAVDRFGSVVQSRSSGITLNEAAENALDYIEDGDPESIDRALRELREALVATPVRRFRRAGDPA